VTPEIIYQLQNRGAKVAQSSSGDITASDSSYDILLISLPRTLTVDRLPASFGLTVTDPY